MAASDKPPFNYIGWLPANSEVRDKFISDLLDSVRRSPRLTHEPAVAKFKEAINADPHMRYLFDEIFEQTSEPPERVVSFDQLLGILDTVIVQPPFYSAGYTEDVPIGVPLYVFFDLFSNTFAAAELFRMPTFNAALKDLLNAFGEFLESDKSTESLDQDENGWFGSAGIKRLAKSVCTNKAPDTERALKDAFNATGAHAEGTPGYDAALVVYARSLFRDTFEVPPSGFQSWDAFFTRPFNDGQRPLGQHPSRAIGVRIYNPCESTVFRIAEGVEWKDKFWIKETQRYSIRDMLLPKDLVDDPSYIRFIGQFTNGTVYQAFLSPYDYHRWHSPIKGTIERIVKIEGSYYAVLPDDVAGEPQGAIIRSQAFLTVSATRVLIYIKSRDDPELVICFIGVGMVEVSTCEVTVNEGAKVEAGDQLGMFHFGGSSSVIVFPGGYNFERVDGVALNNHIWLREYLGAAVKVAAD